MTLREYLSGISDIDLEYLMREHLSWEKDGSLSMNARLRQLTKDYYQDDDSSMIDRVAFEVYRIYALRRMEEKA